ncbi:hypothetical protein S40288_09498 [Stachybotrys chartarum IBT 40288]|nr:hypothetical protein S40288_09498 [Stachybotrys chartarum IBT 40288]
MGYGANVSPVSTTFRYANSNTTLSSSASTTNCLAWSDASSQSSDDTSLSANSSDSEPCESRYRPKTKASIEHALNSYSAVNQPPLQAELPARLRQNPRRTSCGLRVACPPALVRQSDRKVNFVDNLVDSSTQIVEAIWPLSSVACRAELGSKAVLPLRTFIQETLRRSRTSYSTLQVALYYLILIKPHVPRYDFTMEQPDEGHSGRALQCGRRMFLAALILASKYLQDRNYSARAWSKISGLNTYEINQNEIAFLLAVNWKLHIADDVFQRWTEIVLKYTPTPSPPSPGGQSQAITQQIVAWKQLIIELNTDLTNIGGLAALPKLRSATSDLCLYSPRSILNIPQSACSEDASESTPTVKSYNAPNIMEPTPTSAYTPARAASGLGMLPTPRLTPQSSGFCTPAASAASQILGKNNAMGLAMAQASNVNAVQYLDRLPSVTSSPQCYFSARRSSLANSTSTASSPESMVSDLSRSSRSSSISSVSSLASATLNAKLSLPSRFRATKPVNERLSMKPTVPSVPEDHDEPVFTSSPEPLNSQLGRDSDMCSETPLARREQQLEDMASIAASDAARALQELHASGNVTPSVKTGMKRSCPESWEEPLQQNVRGILNGCDNAQPAWPNTLVRMRGIVSETYLASPARPGFSDRKRLCCATEAANVYNAAAVYPALGFRGPGMWEGILN